MKKFIMFACCVAAQGTIFSSEVLLTLQGKPEITVADFENYKENFLTDQPQYRQILQFMPASEQIKIDQNIFAHKTRARTLGKERACIRMRNKQY